MIIKKNVWTEGVAIYAVLFPLLTFCMDVPKKTAADVVLFDQKMAC